MTPSNQMAPLTLEQLDALETYNAGVKFSAHGEGADRITTLRLIAMARQSIILLNAPKPSTLSDTTIKVEATARFGNPVVVIGSEMSIHWHRYKEAFKQGAEFARQYIAQPGAEDAKDRLIDAYKLEAKAAYELLTFSSVHTSTMGPWNKYISAKKDRKRMEDEG